MNDAGLKIRETSAGLEIRIHVLSRAKRNEISGTYNGALKINTTAPPVDDAANKAVIEYLSKLFGIPKSSIRILAGTKSRDKTLQISGLSLRVLLDSLAPLDRSEDE